MKFKPTIILLVFIALWGTACTSYKNVPYLQDTKLDSVTTEQITNHQQLTIQSGDLLAIQANSLNKEQDNLINFNLEHSNGTSAISMDRPGENAVIGYVVDKEGYIKMPFIGSLKVAGLTTFELEASLQTALTTYLTKPLITVRIQNLRVSVLGDVKNPGLYYYSNERMTITEALALAGDMNTTGLRENVLLIREVDGKRKYIRVDLRSKNAISSPYYYLRNNDVLYIQPNKEKVFASDSSLQKFSLLLSALSIVAIFITRVK